MKSNEIDPVGDIKNVIKNNCVFKAPPPFVMSRGLFDNLKKDFPRLETEKIFFGSRVIVYDEK